MLSLIIESTIFLGFSFGFYYFSLRRSRSFNFIRFFFLATLLTAVIIPFIEIEFGGKLPLLGGTVEGEFYTLLPLNGEGAQVEAKPAFSMNAIFLMAYITGLGLMFLRFSMNLIRLSRKAKLGVRVEGEHGRIILTE